MTRAKPFSRYTLVSPKCDREAKKADINKHTEAEGPTVQPQQGWGECERREGKKNRGVRGQVFSHCWSAERPALHSGRRIWSGSRSSGGRSRRRTWSCGRCRRWVRHPSAASADAGCPPRCDAPPVCSSRTAGAVFWERGEEKRWRLPIRGTSCTCVPSSTVQRDLPAYVSKML